MTTHLRLKIWSQSNGRRFYDQPVKRGGTGSLNCPSRKYWFLSEGLLARMDFSYDDRTTG